MNRYGTHGLDIAHPIRVATTPPTEPAMPPSTRDPLDIIERVAAIGVQPGDVLVFEARQDATDQELAAVAARIQQVLGDDTLSIVINGKLGGALRREGNVLVEVTSLNAGSRQYLVGEDPR